MPETPAPTPSRQTVAELARLAGLALTAGQVDKILPDIEALARNVAALEAVDLGETEPAFRFRPDR